jgi:bifunctional aspartokinase / homoserine dehydrogenase 1
MLHVLKFGGSSVANAERIKNSVEIVHRRLAEAKVAVVVSALGGVTDELIAIMDLGCAGDESWKPRFDHLKSRHYTTISQLFESKPESVAPLRHHLDELLDELHQRYNHIQTVGKISASQRDTILSFGERLSCRIFAAALGARGIKAKAFESQHFVRTNDRFGDADVDYETTKQLVNKLLNPVNGTVPVITGFIGSTAQNEITTLGRSGSDFTAGLMGEALNAQFVEIWTDVNGVLTADPNITETAVTIPKLHYSEIAEMAHFGTKVLHPRTVLPLEELNIPIGIYNSFDPFGEGTIITQEYSKTNGTLKSVSLRKDIVLIGVKSKGLDRIQDLLPRAMSALLQAGVQILFNSAASAEFGISFAIEKTNLKTVLKTIQHTFQAEHALGLIDDTIVMNEVSMVTVIGDRLVHDLGLSGAVLSVLGENNIAPYAAAKGVANRHFSMILRNDQAYTAVRLLNDHFCVHSQRVRLFIAGIGTIGGALLKQLKEVESEEYDLSIIGACSSQTSVWNAGGIEPDELTGLLAQSPRVTDWDEIIQTLINDYSYRSVFVDMTGSAEVARRYEDLLKSGIHIATPSKRANTFEQAYFDRLMSYTKNKQTHYLFETTAGAGLPIFQTINDLLRSGDRIFKISGVLSGTMTYVFDQLQQGTPFSEVIRNAKKFGYSEPDPRDDLSGEDVARKFLSLARASGYKIERDELEVESLVPDSLRYTSTETFLEQMSQFDSEWSHRIQQAAAKGEVLRYTGVFEHGKIRIGVESVPAHSPLGSLRGTDNQVALYSHRYRESPIIIQGPGAGAEVTAAGLFADIQKIAIRLIR